MRNKLLSLFLLFMALATLSKAQTKEETIEWINGKFTDFGQNINFCAFGTETKLPTWEQTSVSIQDEEININIKGCPFPESDCPDAPPYVTYTIRLSDIASQYFTRNYNETCNWALLIKSKGNTIKRTVNGSTEYLNTAYFSLRWDDEVGLMNRFNKAFSHLMAFYKKSEAF